MLGNKRFINVFGEWFGGCYGYKFKYRLCSNKEKKKEAR